MGKNYVASNTNLFIRYLPRTVDDAQLRDAFSRFGCIVSAMVKRDIHTGKSLCIAFVRFADPDEAEAARSAMHNSRSMGHRISVQWAKLQHDDTPAGQERLEMRKLFIRNVPFDVSQEDLRCVMSSFGHVVEISLHNDTAAHPVRRRCIAFVTFMEAGAAENALRGLHTTCPFRSCCGIPFICKLSEDYSQKQSRRGDSGATSVASHPQSFEATPQCDCLLSANNVSLSSRNEFLSSNNSSSLPSHLNESHPPLSCHRRASICVRPLDMESINVAATVPLQPSAALPRASIVSPIMHSSGAFAGQQESPHQQARYRHNPYDVSAFCFERSPPAWHLSPVVRHRQ